MRQKQWEADQQRVINSRLPLQPSHSSLVLISLWSFHSRCLCQTFYVLTLSSPSRPLPILTQSDALISSHRSRNWIQQLLENTPVVLSSLQESLESNSWPFSTHHSQFLSKASSSCAVSTKCALRKTHQAQMFYTICTMENCGQSFNGKFFKFT